MLTITCNGKIQQLTDQLSLAQALIAWGYQQWILR